MKKILIVFAVFISFTALAQTNDYKKQPALGFGFTLLDFKTASEIRATSLSKVLQDNNWKRISRMTPALSLGYMNGLNNTIDFSTTLTGAFIDYPFDNTPLSGKDELLLQLDAGINMKMLSDKYWVSPYVSLGLSASKYKSNYGAMLPVGLGLQFNLYDDAFIMLNSQYRVPVTKSTTNYHLFYNLSFYGSLRKRVVPPPPPPPLPPPPPAPEKPKDSDNDGIVDNEDACPNVPGLARYKGCPIPDTDGDGINDEQDKCPTVAGLARYQGCPIPDTDGDGINDEQDKCPTVAGLARYQGCPIPDTDGDGINDELDKCPKTPGLDKYKGCPELVIYYKRAGYTLKPEDKLQLDKVYDFLIANPDVNIVIEGHASTLGTTAYNLKLTQRRAENCFKYLVSKGIAKERMKWVGYGEQFPIGDNSKEEGRAQSRRVVIHIQE